jgi:hypothetical protein
MITLKEIAKRHGLNSDSVQIYLSDAGIMPSAVEEKAPHRNLYDAKAVEAAHKILIGKRVGRGRPRKAHTKTASKR